MAQGNVLGKLQSFNSSAVFAHGALSPRPLCEDGCPREVNFHFQSKGKGKRRPSSMVAVSVHLKMFVGEVARYLVPPRERSKINEWKQLGLAAMSREKLPKVIA